MAFWNATAAELEEFRPGIFSKVERGSQMMLACMEIGPGLEDSGHSHPFDQCGMVVEGRMEMFVGEDRRLLGRNDCYFIPAGEHHGWQTFDEAVRIVDVSCPPKA